MSQTFEVDIPGGELAILKQIEQAGEKNGITVAGSIEKGRFLGLISGDYTISGNTVKVTINKKPSYISWEDAVKRLKEGLEK
jgi:hypothetical protein